MKLIMAIINVILTMISFAAIIANLILGNFGIAWLCTIPFIYELFNCIALFEDD